MQCNFYCDETLLSEYIYLMLNKSCLIILGQGFYFLEAII